jgi:hypothetical protein
MAQEHMQWQGVEWMLTVRFEDMTTSFDAKLDEILRYWAWL